MRALLTRWSKGILAGAAVLSLTVVTGLATAQTGSDEETYRQLDLFGEVFERVRAQYVEEISDEELIEAAIDGMLTSLDPHSSYLSQDVFQDMQVQTRGSFGGLGIEVTIENGLVRVVSPIDDTPAFRAGLEAGDFITHLDGEPVLGLTLNEAVDRMRGPVGDGITLTILRGEEETFDVTIVRDVIRIQSVRWRTEGNVGYIRVTSFTEQTDDGLYDAIDGVRAELGDELIGFVLDLRNNPGGLLDQAIAVTDAFLDRGEIVSTRSREEEDSQRYNASEGDRTGGLPMVILINGGSASASEIVAGALQDHGRAILLGTGTFGKGSVQTIVPLHGHGAMRLTTARYYTPSGRSIQALGIDPDIVVEQALLEEFESESRRESDLRGALGNDQVGDEGEPASSLDRGEPGDDDVSAEEAADAAAEEEPAFDYQLSRAIDILRGVALFNQRVVN